jgi:predicted NUDIX family NTP pyrophosphohydrolase
LHARAFACAFPDESFAHYDVWQADLRSASTDVPKASSAGILVYRRRSRVEVLLVHPGGPFWAKKDDGAWSIPKGEFAEGEDPADAARRELAEETGLVVAGELRPLGRVTQAGGKVVHAWAVEADVDAAAIRSNTFSMEWPPRSGRMQQFPEVDRAAWFSIDEARVKLLPAQRAFLDRLQQHPV